MYVQMINEIDGHFTHQCVKSYLKNKLFVLKFRHTSIQNELTIFIFSMKTSINCVIVNCMSRLLDEHDSSQ